MSTFGDHSPKQVMLEHIESAQFDCGLTNEETIIVLAQVLAFLSDPYESKYQDVIRYKRNDLNKEE